MYYPGQHVIARDGRAYVLVFFMEGVWFGVPLGGASAERTASRGSLPQPLEPRYPCWGGDDERVGADQAELHRVRARRRSTRGSTRRVVGA